MPESITLFGRTIDFLGGSNLALQVIIWSIPIGFVNSVTQYVLIAVNQQRFLTKAFIIGVVFNTVGNLLLIPTFGYVGAAFVTILSEFSLLFPFYYSVKRNVGTVPWAHIIVPPLLAMALMIGAIVLLQRAGLGLLSSTILGWPIYLAGLVLTGALRGEDMQIVADALPLGPLQRFVGIA